MGRVTRTVIYEVNLPEDGEISHFISKPLYASRNYQDIGKPCVGISDRYLAEVRAIWNGDGSFQLALFFCQYVADESSSSPFEVHAELATTEVLVRIARFLLSYSDVS